MNRADRRAEWRERNRVNVSRGTGSGARIDADTSKPKLVNVSIGKLVLEGYHWSDRYAIGEAMQAELRTLIATQGVPDAFRTPATISRFRSPTISTSPAASPTTIGSAVAGAIYRGGGS